MTFTAWYAEVNAKVQRFSHVALDELGDCAYRDWYDDGVTPARAAYLALKENGYPFK